MVYTILCSCGRIYIGTLYGNWRIEHEDACTNDASQKSSIPDHAGNENHPIEWIEGPINTQVRKRIELALNEALQIQQTPQGQIGIKLPNSFVAALESCSVFHTDVWIPLLNSHSKNYFRNMITKVVLQSLELRYKTKWKGIL